MQRVADEFGVAVRTVRDHYAREDWRLHRADFRARAAEEAISEASGRIGRGAGEVLAGLGEVASASIAQARVLLNDPTYLASRATVSDLSRAPALFAKLLVDLKTLELQRHGIEQQASDLLARVSRVIERELPEAEARALLASIVETLGA